MTEMRPTQLCTQCVHNPLVGEYFGKPDHMPQVSSREPLTKLSSQFSTHCGDNLLPVPRPFFLQDVLADTFTYAPVEEDQRRVHLPRHYDHYRYVLMQSLPLFVSPWQKFCCKFLSEVCTFKKPKSGVYYNYK